MTRPDIEKVPDFYKPYVELVKDMDVMDALRFAGKKFNRLFLISQKTKVVIVTPKASGLSKK